MDDEMLRAYRQCCAEERELHIANVRCTDHALVSDTQYSAKLMRNEELTKQLRCVVTEYMQAKCSCDSMNRSLALVLDEIEILKKQMKGSEEEIDGLNIQLESATDDLSLMRSNLRTSKDALIDALERMHALADENEKLISEIQKPDRLRYKEIYNDRKIQELQEQERKLVEQLHALRKDAKVLRQILYPDYSVYKVIGTECLLWLLYFSLPGFAEPKIEDLRV